MNTKTRINPHARHRARRFALQALYQWQIVQHNPKEIIQQFLQEPDAVKTDLNYFEEILQNVIAQHEQLDQQMRPFLDRPLLELDPIEHAILRISTYELTHRTEIPYRVIINEAIELAKKFGATEGHKYINGVLDRMAKQLRPIEINKIS